MLGDTSIAGDGTAELTDIVLNDLELLGRKLNADGLPDGPLLLSMPAQYRSELDSAFEAWTSDTDLREQYPSAGRAIELLSQYGLERVHFY